jgi:hypothetical protein
VTHFQLMKLMLHTARIHCEVISLITQTFLRSLSPDFCHGPFQSPCSERSLQTPLSSASTLFLVLKIVRPKIASVMFLSIFFYLFSTLMTASVVQWSEFLATERRCIVFAVRYELNLCKLCIRKYPDGCLTPRRTGRLTVSRNITLTFFFRLPLWSSRQSSWLQIQRSLFDSLRYQIF